MTTDELYEKLQEDLAARIVDEQMKYERQKIRRGLGNSLPDRAAATAIAAFRKAVRYNRAYAIEGSPEAVQEFAALALAAQKQSVSLTEVMRVLAMNIEGWRQQRPPDDTDVLPLPTDPVTGERIRNPWLPLPNKEGIQQFDLRSQRLIREASPRLAKWLEDCAANGGQASLAMLDELNAEQRKAEKLRKLPYGEREWEANMLRQDLGGSLADKSNFALSIEDPDVLEFHRHEAKLGAPSAQFNNLGVRMALAKEDPKIREVHKAAGELVRQWKTQEQAQKGKAA